MRFSSQKEKPGMSEDVKLVTPESLLPELRKLYDDGYPRGFETGWVGLDKLYKPALGMWTLITGYAGHGKSEWLDALMVNLAERHNWQFAIFSPENHPVSRHQIKLLEKHLRKPFMRGFTERMEWEETDADLIEFMNTRFRFIHTENPSLPKIVGKAVEWAAGLVTRPGGIVIDPWNQLEHLRPQGMSETEYISQSLSELIRVSRDYNVHIWVVAHPAKDRAMMRKNPDDPIPVPRPMDVAGSMHWWNKSDNCLTVYRVRDSQEVEIHVQKVRFKYYGEPGVVTLRYDRVTGRYNELRIVSSEREPGSEG